MSQLLLLLLQPQHHSSLKSVPLLLHLVLLLFLLPTCPLYLRLHHCSHSTPPSSLSLSLFQHQWQSLLFQSLFLSLALYSFFPLLVCFLHLPRLLYPHLVLVVVVVVVAAVVVVLVVKRKLLHHLHCHRKQSYSRVLLKRQVSYDEP